MKKKTNTTRLVFLLLVFGFVATVWWYVDQLNAVFDDFTTTQIINSVTVTIFSVGIVGDHENYVINSPIIYVFACIVLVPFTRGIVHMVKSRRQEKRTHGESVQIIDCAKEPIAVDDPAGGKREQECLVQEEE